MTRTRQLDAHRACRHVDDMLESVVLAYRPVLVALTAEVYERADTHWNDPRFDAVGQRRRRLRQIARLRAAVVALADVLADVRRDIGTDKGELPPGDAAVRDELARLSEVERAVGDVGVPL
jgi:hypothetical protein